MTNRRHSKAPRFVSWLGDMTAMRLYLASKPWLSPVWGILKLTNATLRSLGVVAFANSPLTGALILTGMFMGNPYVGLAAVIGALIGVIGSKVLGAPDMLVCDGVTAFNSALVGCISTVVSPAILGSRVDALHWLAVAAAAAATCYVDVGLNALMAPCGLPAQSMPFNLVTAVGFLAARGRFVGHALHDVTSPEIIHEPVYSGGNTTSWMMLNGTLEEPGDEHIQWLNVVQGSVLAAGQVYGVGNMTSSILIWLGFFVFSPILACFFFLGSAIGTSFGCLLSPGSLDDAYAGLWGYNSLLTAGGVSYFLAPSAHMFVAALVAAVISVFTQAAIMPLFMSTQVPVLSYPFNVAITLVLGISTQTGSALQFLKDRSYHEKHVYDHYSSQGAASTEEPEVELGLRTERYQRNGDQF